MRIEQVVWSADASEGGWHHRSGGSVTAPGADLALVFGSPGAIQNTRLIAEVRAMFPNAELLGCSSAGEIAGTRVSDDTLSVTAIDFAHTTVRPALVRLAGPGASYQAGQELGRALANDGLVHVFVLSDGLQVNGSELVRGLEEALPGVGISGGLSGDGDRFARTFVLAGSTVESGIVAGVGLYGDRLRVGCASLGGWDPFGPERLVTRSEGNVLHELDGRSALELYRSYLGEHAQELPSSGLLFPLSVRVEGQSEPIVRTLLSVDEAAGTMTFAGDVPKGATARLMKANFDRLIEGAVGAAQTSYQAVGSATPELAILISCVGRKLVLKQRIEEEVEGVQAVLGAGVPLTGFYSYGEISPFTPNARCELHNQTMTITTLAELAA